MHRLAPELGGSNESEPVPCGGIYAPNANKLNAFGMTAEEV